MVTSVTSRPAYRTPPNLRAVALSDHLEVPNCAAKYVPDDVFVAGKLEFLSPAYRRVAVVGSRDATPLGRARSAKLARLLAARGVIVVSGLAKGIDVTAHTNAISAGGRTIAVIGTPMDRAYPAEHSELQAEIARDHLLMSQFPVGQRIERSNFVRRNRLMALISDASVVIEAGDGSGTLSQAAETQRLGKPLFIAKSVLERDGLRWPQRFLDAGAQLLTEVDDVLNALEGGPHAAQAPLL